MTKITLAELDARIARCQKWLSIETRDDDLAEARHWTTELEIFRLARTALAIKGGEEEARRLVKELRDRGDFPEAFHNVQATASAMKRAAELLERVYGTEPPKDGDNCASDIEAMTGCADDGLPGTAEDWRNAIPKGSKGKP